ncbi:hypothetical protein D3C84_696420 [compost metagenome]
MRGRRVTGNRKTGSIAGNSAAGNVCQARIKPHTNGAPGSLYGAAIEVEGGIIDGDVTGLRAIGIERRSTVQHVVIQRGGAINGQDLARDKYPCMSYFTDQQKGRNG